MFEKTQVLVVSPPIYKDLARQLAHEISKKTNLSGAYWTIKHYINNEFSQGGHRLAIFIGNPSENSLTKDFHTVVKSIENKNGACFGYDGPKAFVYGEGKIDALSSFKKYRDDYLKSLEAEPSFFSYGAIIANTLFAPNFGPMHFFYDLISYISRAKRLRREQTEIALSHFLKDHFDSWAGLKKPESDPS